MVNSAVVLAAGAGTRMKSRVPKVLHEVCGKSMIKRVVEEVKASNINDITVVIGNGWEDVKKCINDLDVSFVFQEKQLGTGHAVQMAEEKIHDEGNVVILCGDMPLIRRDTLHSLMGFHENSQADITVLTANVERPFGYGRIVKGLNGELIKIVEEKDADEDQRKINEINSGIYCFRSELLKKHLCELGRHNTQGEYYLTDLIEIGVKNGYIVKTFDLISSEEILGVNSRKQLAEAETIMRKRIVEKHMDQGVTFINPEHSYIDSDVFIGMDTIIYPGVTLKGNTVIGKDCIIGDNSKIVDSTIEDSVEIQNTIIINSLVKKETTIGPFAYLRPGSHIGEKVKIGDFVEIKNSVIGDGTKASHLAYVGDAQVGKNVNIGCGVVFVNYNGKEKQKVKVEDEAFIGSNVNLVAPVKVNKRGFVAAGTTVTLEVPEGALCIGREKQKHIKEWVDRKKLKENKK